MALSFLKITPEQAQHIKLLMADVDGTLNKGGDEISLAVLNAVHGLQQKGIMVGLVSGRTDPMLISMASNLGITGPIIAENGAVARLSPRNSLMDLGYSRQPALKALKKLKAKYPDVIQERWDNDERMIDLVFRADGIPFEEIQKLVKGVQVLDSTYIYHLMQKGIDKGSTLVRLLKLMDCARIKPDEVICIGDSMTDMSLFEHFPGSVLVPNPNIPAGDRKKLREKATYTSDHQAGAGFAEVALHIISART